MAGGWMRVDVRMRVRVRRRVRGGGEDENCSETEA